MVRVLVGGTLALHRGTAEDAGRSEPAFEADEPPADVADRLRAAGFEPGLVTDEGFGFSLRVRDPDGVWVQVDRYDRELYT